MPELPEVETIKNDLRQKILGQKIKSVEIKKDKAVNYLVDSFVSALKSNSFSEIERRGKLMIFRISRPVILSKAKSKIPFRGNPSINITSVLVHLKMTGQLIYERRLPVISTGAKRSGEISGVDSSAALGMTAEKSGPVEVVAGGHKLTEKDFDLPNKHTQVIFTFENGGKLFFNDLRRFGYMKIATDEEVKKAEAGYGIEPLTKEFTWPVFEKAIGKRKLSIKAALMDQKRIAGIGNIYADETCFCAGVLPMRRVDTLTPDERKKVFSCIPKILKLAVKHRGTSFKDYLDSEGKKGNFINFLNVYDREGEPCRNCGGKVKKIKSGGRGTHYCPACQK